jgi:hypothetical protein
MEEAARRWEYDNKVGLNEIVSKISSWISLAQAVNHWKVLMKKIMTLPVLKGGVGFFTS